MRIEILCTGDEILTGKTVNTNYSHIARRLADIGFEVQRGVTVGDDRDALLAAFREAAARSDAVIVNGGLGPTVDDLSQEVAAEAAGVDLVLHEEWLARMQEFYARRNRVMPANNRKQAMLPASAEMIDNPIGTACGFALAIGKARFFFTPGVPREMRRMLDEQVLPRLLAQSGMKGVSRLKRFHTFGIGESRADEMLAGIDSLAIDGAVKLGFQAHYPQLETKLAARGLDAADLDAKLAAVEAEVRRRLGNFVVAEDDQTLEGVLLSALSEQGRPSPWRRCSPPAMSLPGWRRSKVRKPSSARVWWLAISPIWPPASASPHPLSGRRPPSRRLGPSPPAAERPMASPC